MDQSDRWRRRVGLAFLAAAGGMLLAGLTFLESGLRGLTFVVYWLGCAGFALGALAIAAVDMAVMRRRFRQERRALAREVFGATQREGADRQDPADPGA